jgi:phosphatidylglycerol:prolipoprotein diacylglycerol transferase
MFVNNLDPVAISLFNIDIRWYSLAYIFGLIFSIQYGKFLITKNNFFKFEKDILDDYLPYAILGIILGGRIGYILFYDLAFYIKNPIEIFYIWQGGMSFHGGLVGIILISLYFVKKKQIDFYVFSDLLALISPIGLFLGRIANFINSELIGLPSNLPWSVIFVKIDQIPRHPSQLYEALLEGIMLFVILNLIFKFKKIKGYISAYFLILYSFFRIVSEQFRLPDEHLGYVLGNLSMGSVLSIIILLIGIFILRDVKNSR